MTTKYAVLLPVCDPRSDLEAFFSPLFNLKHRMSYEYVCGWSLGHSPVFYDTYEDALQHEGIDKVAIIECEINNETVTKLKNIHNFNEFKEVFREVSDAEPDSHSAYKEHFFERERLPVFTSRVIKDKEVSKSALEKFNEAYQQQCCSSVSHRM